MVYMACCPGIGKRAAQLLALAAFCVAAFWFGLRDPPTNIGSGAIALQSPSTSLQPGHLHLPDQLRPSTALLQSHHPLLPPLVFVSEDAVIWRWSYIDFEHYRHAAAEGHLHPSGQQHTW